ncbi:hypothetical protein HDU67_000162 [Dinochytrium kinnereticum]|nr:hypothetical protein HDU67_000162 [Dinochytrium kinnereticum]
MTTSKTPSPTRTPPNKRHSNGFFSSDEDEDTFLQKLGIGRPPTPTTLLPPQPPTHINTQTTLTFPFLPHPITILEDSSGGCGGKTWEAAEVLGRHLGWRGGEYLRGRRVVEVGAGTGVVGIVAGLVMPGEGGGEVVVTDMMFLELMRRNVAVNFGEGDGRVRVEMLKWGDPIPPSCLPCDLILASDCVYLESAFDPLIETLKAMAGPDTEILIVSKRRRKADKRFFVKLRKGFVVEEVTDDPGYPKFSREGLSILRAWKKKEKDVVG